MFNFLGLVFLYVYLLLFLGLLLVNHESTNSQTRLGDLDRDALHLVFRFLLFDGFWEQVNAGVLFRVIELFFLLWDFGNSDATCLSNSTLVCGIVDLLELLLLSSSGWVDVMSQELLSWVNWVNVALTVGVEGWLSEVGRESRISKPSSGCVDFYKN